VGLGLDQAQGSGRHGFLDQSLFGSVLGRRPDQVGLKIMRIFLHSYVELATGCSKSLPEYDEFDSSFCDIIDAFSSTWTHPANPLEKAPCHD